MDFAFEILDYLTISEQCIYAIQDNTLIPTLEQYILIYRYPWE